MEHGPIQKKKFFELIYFIIYHIFMIELHYKSYHIDHMKKVFPQYVLSDVL